MKPFAVIYDLILWPRGFTMLNSRAAVYKAYLYVLKTPELDRWVRIGLINPLPLAPFADGRPGGVWIRKD